MFIKKQNFNFSVVYVSIFLILITILIISCKSSSTDANNQLVIATFGGDWGNAQRTVWFNEFEKQYDVKIISTEYNGDYNQTKLKAKAGEWDVIDIEELEVLRGIEDSLWLPINYENINKESIIKNAALKEAVGSVAYSIVLGFNPTKVNKDDIVGWVSFFSPEKIHGPRGMRTSPQYIIEAIWMANGGSLQDLYYLPIEDTKLKLKEYLRLFKEKVGKGNIITFETYGQPQDMIERETVIMAYGTNGRMMAKKLEGKNVDVCWNQSILTIEYYVISKASKNKELAQKFIDFILAKENQAKMGRFIPYGPVNNDAFQELTVDEKSLLPTSPEIYPKTVLYNAGWWMKNEKEIRDIYREFLLLN